METSDMPGGQRARTPNVREHMAFGRGKHSRPGAPPARVEAEFP